MHRPPLLRPLARALVACAVLAMSACGSRTGLGAESYRSDAVFCADATWRARPNMALRLYAGVPQRLRGLAVWRVTASPPGATARVQSEGGEDATFVADAEGDYLVEVAIPQSNADAGDGFARCTLRVTVRQAGPVALCPPDLVTQPLRRVELAGGAQADRGVDSVEWSLLDAPNSSSRPRPDPDDAPRTRFTPDVAGVYRLRLQVTDDAGARDQCTTVVRAVPLEGLRVELSWDPPGRSCPTEPGAACDSSDVDLHLLRASAGAGWGSNDDCYWFNCNVAARRTLAWSGPGTADDPRLDLDDVTGHGPENVNIDRPSERSYRVGVHYYAADGAGPQAATLTLYCGSPEPVARLGPVVLRANGTSETNDFWIAADVLPDASPGGCTVRPIARGGQPWIVPYATARTSPGPAAP